MEYGNGSKNIHWRPYGWQKEFYSPSFNQSVKNDILLDRFSIWVYKIYISIYVQICIDYWESWHPILEGRIVFFSFLFFIFFIFSYLLQYYYYFFSSENDIHIRLIFFFFFFNFFFPQNKLQVFQIIFFFHFWIILIIAIL